MSKVFPWYETTTGPDIEQGDFLYECTHYRFEPDGELIGDQRNCVILSHSCDLSNGKLQIVQVCPFAPLEELEDSFGYLRTRKGREELRRGNLPGYHLLNKCEIEGSVHDFLVVDFRSLFGIPLDLARNLAISQSPRVRLLPPYREHLAQAFARFFMRVGLPIDVPAFN